MSVGWIIKVVAIYSIFTFIVGLGILVTVERSLSVVQWVGLMVFGVLHLFLVYIGAILTHVKLTTTQQSLWKALPQFLLKLVLLFMLFVAVVIFGVVPIAQTIYDRHSQSDESAVGVTEVAPLDEEKWWQVTFESAVTCEGSLLLASSVSRSAPSPDCDGTPRRHIRFMFNTRVVEGTAIVKIEILSNGQIRGIWGHKVDLHFDYVRASDS